MPPFDREAALKAAEKALKLGKVDAAIAEYVKVVEAQPRDWNSANALGDLYVRAKQIEKGVEQYTRIADHLAEEGFYPKAAALYQEDPQDQAGRRVLAAPVGRSGREAGHAGRRQAVLHCRSPNAQGSAATRRAPPKSPFASARSIPKISMRACAPAQLAAEMGDTATALREYQEVAGRLEKAGTLRRRARAAAGGLRPRQVGRRRSAAGCSRPISAIDPDAARKRGEGRRRAEGGGRRPSRRPATPTRRSTCSARSRKPIPPTSKSAPAWRSPTSRAAISTRPHLSVARKPRAANPALWLTLAEMELRGNRFAEGKAAVVQALTLDRDQAQAAVVLGCRLAEIECRSRLSADRRGRRRRARARAISPPRRWRSTNSPRACARTSSR